ncbi:MAG TPA: hypothetical protein VER26_13270 [Xanthobacteraceae bacterium]|jgi:hypothetical protein|nr:hypothetical protein [Xanthobacteraceae bacterium]
MPTLPRQIVLWSIIISDLPQCSKSIVQRTHGIVNSVGGIWFAERGARS